MRGAVCSGRWIRELSAVRATTAIRSSRRRRGCRWSCCSGAPALSSRRSTTSRPGARSTLPPQHGSAGQLFPTSPVSADAILLTSMRIEPLADDLDLGDRTDPRGRGRSGPPQRARARGVRDPHRRRCRTEHRGSLGDGGTRLLPPAECMISAEFLEDMGGFEVVAPHPRFPPVASRTGSGPRMEGRGRGRTRPAHRGRIDHDRGTRRQPDPRSELADRLAVSRETSGVTQKRSTAGPEPAVLRCAG